MSKLAAIKPGELVTRDDFASAIAQRWRDSVAAIIDAGRLLLGAKAALSHGEFTPMVENSLPFGRQTAFRLMAIAEHSILSNVTHVQHLPSSWGTVYELTKIPDEPLQQMLGDGTIHPDLRRSEVVKLRRLLLRAENGDPGPIERKVPGVLRRSAVEVFRFRPHRVKVTTMAEPSATTQLSRWKNCVEQRTYQAAGTWQRTSRSQPRTTPYYSSGPQPR